MGVPETCQSKQVAKPTGRAPELEASIRGGPRPEPFSPAGIRAVTKGCSRAIPGRSGHLASSPCRTRRPGWDQDQPDHRDQRAVASGHPACVESAPDSQAGPLFAMGQMTHPKY